MLAFTRRSFQAGALQFERYAGLVDSTNLPFVRATSSQRVLDSAKAWAAGMLLAQRIVSQALTILFLFAQGLLPLQTKRMCLLYL